MRLDLLDLSPGRSSRSLRIRGEKQSVSMLRNAPGPSGAPLPEMASPSRSLRISLECKLGGVSGPSEPHLPDTTRLRQPLRTTQVTGPNHFSPSDWRVPFAPENPRLKQFSPVHQTCPIHIRQRKRWKNRKNAKTRKKPRRKTPKERHEKPPRKHGPTTTRKTKPKPKTERSKDNLGQTGRCVPLTQCFLNVTDPFGLSSDKLSGPSTAHWPFARLTGLLHLKMTPA